jgi:acid phosphatase (class A)
MEFNRLTLLFVVALAGCAGRVEIPEAVPELRPGVLRGYLEPAALPDSAALLPPPPAAGSAAEAHDRELSEIARTLRGTPRWELAATDAVLAFPAAAATFSCALGLPVSEAATPNLYMLLRRSLADAGLSTYAAKNLYQRERPFVANGQPTCTPDEEPMLRDDGAYPSGHAALGWAWGLILAELAPERADALLARGRAFAESRVVCNVHWASDVAEGRTMGAAAVARLHGDPVFRAQLELARREVAALRASGAQPAGDCAGAAALDAPLAVPAASP